MKLPHFIFFLIALLLAPVLSFGGNTELALSLDAGYTDNIFHDATAYSDTYTKPAARFDYYPASLLRLSMTGSYTAYSTLTGLNQTFGSGSLTFVKANPEKPISLYLTGGFNTSAYSLNYNLYNNNQTYASTEIRFRLLKSITLASGGHFNNIIYTKTDFSDYYQYNLYGGLHVSLPLRNSLYTEVGYSRAEFEAMRDWRQNFIPGPDTFTDPISQLDLKYLQIRLSRPLATHTGLNLQFRTQFLAKKEGDAFRGYSVDILSPWHQFNYGTSYSVGIKSFAVPGFIIAGNAQYSDLSYFRTIETVDDTEPYLKNRDDKTVNVSLELQRPLGKDNSALIIPTLIAGFTDNRSTDPFYDYKSFVFSLGLNIQL